MKTVYRTFVCKKRAGLISLGDRINREKAIGLLTAAKNAGARYGWVEEVTTNELGEVAINIIETFNIASIEVSA